jgi:RHS repeat-associated protein
MPQDGFDSETGFVYFGKRYYVPNIGRWVTPDPIGFADGPNRYAYVYNNPMSKFDLYGLFIEDDEVGISHVSL